MELSTPGDRQGEFEPVLVPNHQRRLSGLAKKLLQLHSRRLMYLAVHCIS
ncbi:MAG: transposase [Synechococcus sp.]